MQLPYYICYNLCVCAVSNLTTILQGSGIALSRSASSVGEHVSTSFVNMPVPKRAETFAGFDAAHECKYVLLWGMVL